MPSDNSESSFQFPTNDRRADHFLPGTALVHSVLESPHISFPRIARGANSSKALMLWIAIYLEIENSSRHPLRPRPINGSLGLQRGRTMMHLKSHFVSPANVSFFLFRVLFSFLPFSTLARSRGFFPLRECVVRRGSAIVKRAEGKRKSGLPLLAVVFVFWKYWREENEVYEWKFVSLFAGGRGELSMLLVSGSVISF